ncbi:MAG: carbohydrate kinase family protein [Clostridia bacterium]|nr:carbohydrate kinase family protein [Clostridia bacterium]
MGKGIVVAGDIVLDVLKVITRFPERNGLVRIIDKSFSLGGAVSNTGRDLACLDPGLKVSLAGMIGEDAEGDEILREFSRYKNIDTSRVIRKGQTSFTDVLTENDTRVRTFLFYGGSNDIFDYSDIDVKNLDCDLFHIGYILLLNALDAEDEVYGTHMARLLHDVQQMGIPTSVDVVSEVGDRYKVKVPPALKYTDYFIVNEIESGKTVGIDLRGENDELLVDRIPEVLARLRRMGVRRWIVIHSPEGGFGLDENDNYVQLPSPELPRGFIVGTVGAGDAFCAGVLLAAYNGCSLEQGIADGIATATMSLKGAGASDAMRPIAEARALYDSLPKRRL